MHVLYMTCIRQTSQFVMLSMYSTQMLKIDLEISMPISYHVSKSGSFIKSFYFHAEIQQFFINAHSSTNVWNSSMKDKFWLSWKTDVGNGYTFCDAQFHCLILSDNLKT